MKFADTLGITFGNAICYSGYREGQSPLRDLFPSYQQIVEDLKILQGHWQYLRLYDCSRHAELVLRAIRDEGFDFKVMLGVDVGAEMQSPDCAWVGEYPEKVLEQNRLANDRQVDRLIELANEFSDSVFAVSVGNEATVEWGDHRVPVERLIGFARRVRSAVRQPVTFCENYAPWVGLLEPLAAELDFISLHSYPVWEYRGIDAALDYTKENFKGVARHYPDKPVVITEAGWATCSNGRGIEVANASQSLQAEYYRQLMEWSRRKQILTFVFEAFDEPWKGSNDPQEPEKHWGLFTVDRRPKQVMRELYWRLDHPSAARAGVR
jgi:exo-beta-1,3-glucanase (GH17 family)